MSRRGGNDEPFLFDPPLGRDEDAAGPAPPPARRPGAAEAAGPEARTRRPEDAAGADLPLFAPDPFADPLAGERFAAEPPAAEPPRPPAAAHRDAAAPDDAGDDAGFPFGERPPPHRPASPAATPHRPAAHPLRPAADPAGWDVVDVAAEDEEAADLAGAERLSPAAAALAPAAAGLAPRLLAAAVDGAVLVAVAALAVVGAVLLDLRPGAAALPGLAALLVVFSFAYSVVPLAFWGATPGMAAARLVARDRDGGPLTFGQTALRWTAGLLTLLLAGLPMLLALRPLGGRSPADRLSGSRTWTRPRL